MKSQLIIEEKIGSVFFRLTTDDPTGVLWDLDYNTSDYEECFQPLLSRIRLSDIDQLVTFLTRANVDAHHWRNSRERVHACPTLIEATE